jgi:putative ABC transport system substrate-binding protein
MESSELNETDSAARLLALKLQILEVSGASHLESAFDLAKRGRAEAVNVLSSAFFTAQRQAMVELAARNRLPAMYVDSTYSDAGGLMSYGASTLEMYRRGAYYVDKILKALSPPTYPWSNPRSSN